MTSRKPAPPLSPVEMMRVIEFRIHDGDPKPEPCCARCQRGTRALGDFGCGNSGFRCHENKKFMARWGAEIGASDE